LVYNISYKRSVARDLKVLSQTNRKRIISRLEKSLGNDPLSQQILKGPFAGLRRLRVGDHRVIYMVEEKEVLILRIGHPREVYR